MSGYGYYGDEGEGLLTGGGTRSFAIFNRAQLAGLSRAERLKVIRQAKKVPALAWGIRKWNFEKRAQDLKKKNSRWMELVKAAIQQASQEYYNELSDNQKTAYKERKAKAEQAKARKLGKIQLVKNYLESLKGNNPQETAMNITNALAREGTANVRLLRSAMKLLYPERYGNLKGKQLAEAMKQFTVRGAPKYPRAQSAIGNFEPKLEAEIQPPEVKEEQPPPQPTTKEKPKQKK
jgi:murein L,D-transpeptidase YcbB/YkuD